MSDDNCTVQGTLWDGKINKQCSRCGVFKPLSEFGSDVCNSDKRKPFCRFCSTKAGKAIPRVKREKRTHKRCFGCKEIKTLDNFYVAKRADRKGNYQISSYCRICNPQICRERSRARIKSGKATLDYKERYKKKRWERLLKQYGVTRDAYEELERLQNGLCAICGKPETLMYKDVLCRLVVDHDHETGKIRGLLCRNCNIGLGNFKDEADRVQKAADYLKRHKSL